MMALKGFQIRSQTGATGTQQRVCAEPYMSKSFITGSVYKNKIESAHRLHLTSTFV